MSPAQRFLALWTLAIVAATAAFVLRLAIRVRSVELGYEIGRAHAHVARLREVERVLAIELASHENPERVELVARTLFGMAPPSPDRVVSAGLEPRVEAAEEVAGAPPRATPAGAAAEEAHP